MAMGAQWLAKIDEARQAIIGRASKLRAQRDELPDRYGSPRRAARGRTSSRMPS
ncbi:MAG: hypothetical protein ACXU89_15200 [Xanthobacteraceae bacterium]